MFLVTGEEMGQLDRKAIEEYHLPGMVLMEQAALRVVELVDGKFCLDPSETRVIVFAGKGNNGGDGLAIARLLKNSGANVSVFLTCQPEDLKGDALLNYQILQKFGGRIHLLQRENDLQRVNLAFLNGDLIIDALYGTGFKGRISGLIADLVKMINESSIPVISVDLPSGIDGDTGKVDGDAIRAHATVTFGLPKLGLIQEPGASYVGELWLGNISLPPTLLSEGDFKTELITLDKCQKLLPQRPSTGHKGIFGHIFAIGGSEGMTGAISLAAKAALRTGAGLVTIGIPRSLNAILEMKLTEIMTRPLPETEETTIGLEALDPILEQQKQTDVFLLGPGMSQHPSTQSLLKNLLKKIDKPVVIDADGLNMLKDENLGEFFRVIKGPIILTPHPGEMANLLGISTREVQTNRLTLAEKAAKEWGVTLILKGAKTIIATPEGKLYINPTGNPGMATGGSGDVLAGIIASFLGQGLKPTQASLLAVYLHGLAGDLGAKKKGQFALTAGDLLDELPNGFLFLKEKISFGANKINERLLKIC